MNKKNILLVVTLAMSILISSCAAKSGGGITAAGSGLDSLTAQGGEWILKIDDMTVFEDKFNKEFEYALTMRGGSPEQIALAKNNPTAKQQFLDELIGQILLLTDPEAQAFFESEDNKDFLVSAFRSFQVQYYSQKLMEDAMLEMPEPTQQQIAGLYEQHKAALAQQYGITELNSQTIPYISQMIKQEQAQQRVLISISDLKDRARIDRNKDIIGDIAPSIPGAGPDTSAVAPNTSEDGVLR